MSCDRRTALLAGLSMAVGPVAAGGATTGPPPDDAVRAAADDFGHLVHEKPERVLRPASSQAVAAAVTWAGSHGRRLAARGQGHSVYGRSQVRDGVVADLSGLRTVHGVAANRVIVDAGARWSEVLAATLPSGLVPPALPDYLELSVGGTLVVGGIGSTVSRSGAVCDNVLELRVVTGTGAELACSPTRNAELFDAVRAGLGQVGVITRATLALIPAARRIRRFLLVYPDLRTMLADSRLLTRDGRFDAVQGAVLAAPDGGWVYRLDLAVEVPAGPPDDEELLAGLSDNRPAAQRDTLSLPEYLGRLGALEQATRANGQWFLPHPWLTTFVGDAAVEDLVSAELAALTPADLGPFGQVVLSPVRRAALTSPLLRLPDGELCHTFNLVRMPASAADADRLVAANRAIYERVRAVGGTLYPVSAFPMSGADWRAHFGPAFPVLDDAKRVHDPRHVLTPGYEVY